MDVTNEAVKVGKLEIGEITLKVRELDGNKKLLESLP